MSMNALDLQARQNAAAQLKAQVVHKTVEMARAIVMEQIRRGDEPDLVTAFGIAESFRIEEERHLRAAFEELKLGL